MSEFPYFFSVSWPFWLFVRHWQPLDIQRLPDGTWEIRAL